MVFAQPGANEYRVAFIAARDAFDNGNFNDAAERALRAAAVATDRREYTLAYESLELAANSQLSLQKYDDAENSLRRAEKLISERDVPRKARLQLRFSLLSRQRKNFSDAFQYAKNAITLLPSDRLIQGEYFYLLGRIFFAQGFDASAIIWLEKSQRIFEAEKGNPLLLDTYRFLSLAWTSKLSYQDAQDYAEKWVAAARETRFKYKHRQALFELAALLSTSGQNQRSRETAELGLKLSRQENNSLQSSDFLAFLLLKSLAEGDIDRSNEFVGALEKTDRDRRYAFEQLLAEAIIAAYQGRTEASNRLFASLKEMPNSSEFLLPIWRIAVAKKARNWQEVINLNEKLLELNLKENFREDLPSIYLDFASAYFHLGQTPKARENLEKSLAFIEDIRHSENSALSLSLFATFHNAYRLSAQIEMSKPLEAFERADFLKGRLLKDLISDAARRSRTELSSSVRQKLEALSLKFIENPNEPVEIERAEKVVTQTIPGVEIIRPDLKQIATNPNLDNTAVISYFFTLDGRLVAFAFQKNQPIKSVYIPVSEDEIKRQAFETEQKIKGRTFFKRDGKNLYDQLLAPLNLSAKHIIIVPDKFLWKIPFQALSPDGEKYLIEDKIVSYAPSISVLMDQLKSPKPYRKSVVVFANPDFNNKRLSFVTREARTVASLFGAHAIENATETDFRRFANRPDILHFSMHAEIDREQPLKSFLGMKPVSGADGRLTVGELLDVKLKKGSLVFLASCDTNNIFNGEGLVSLSWGMMGAGASTVISAQWEANDRSTELFTRHFYNSYRTGVPSAESMQVAARAMIRDKLAGSHEPYFWAAFSLQGDYR